MSISHLGPWFTVILEKLRRMVKKGSGDRELKNNVHPLLLSNWDQLMLGYKMKLLLQISFYQKANQTLSLLLCDLSPISHNVWVCVFVYVQCQWAGFERREMGVEGNEFQLTFSLMWLTWLIFMPLLGRALPSHRQHTCSITQSISHPS